MKLYRFVSYLIIPAIFHLYHADGRKYDNYEVWRMKGQHIQDLLEVCQIYSLDVWSIRKDHVDIMIQPELVEFAEKTFRMFEFRKNILIKNVQLLIDQQKYSTNKVRSDLNIYNDLVNIYEFILNMAAESSIVSSEIIGTSFEGREIMMAKVSSAVSPTRKAVWIDCGIHAREWISPSTCLLFLDTLVSSYGKSDLITHLVDTYDFYILPVLNVDGYDYTWKVDRMWRKNRTPYGLSFGVDLNRNFGGPEWGTVGSSVFPSSNVYHGPSPFSENETSAVRDTIEYIQTTTKVEALFSIHSYGHMWLHPYGYQEEPALHESELTMVSSAGVSAIKDTHGVAYSPGSFYNVLYPGSGTTIDWSYEKGIIHSYLLELRDNGTYGFLLPESEIVPTATEIFNGIIGAIQAIPK